MKTKTPRWHARTLLVPCLLFLGVLITPLKRMHGRVTQPMPSQGAAPAAQFGHIIIVIGENTNASDAESGLPWLDALAAQYAMATQFYANTHPSIGNYFMMTTGQILTNDDSKEPSSFPVSVDNVVRELLAFRKTWKAYAESLTSVGFTGGDSGDYAVRHNPLAYLTDVQNNAGQKKNLVPFQQFAKDLATGQLPNYSFVIPNLCDDAHDCVATTFDDWLKQNIAPLLTNRQFLQDGLLLVTWDESADDNTNGGGRVQLVLAGPTIKRGFKSTSFYQIPSMLRLSLEGMGVTTLPGAAARAPAMSEFFTTISSSP